MMRRVPLLLAALAVITVGPAAAYDAATTHAGMTERAALAAQLGHTLTRVFGLPLGLYEPLRLPFTGAWGERLGDSLAKLDAAQGYAPGNGREGRLPALEWLVAGSVVEEVPARRVANHFLDPLTGRGLSQGDYLGGTDLRVAELRAGAASGREVMVGTAQSGHGDSSIDWMTSSLNDRGLACFLENRRRAVDGETREARNAALARTLLCAGALLHVVEDAAEPALVRGDFRVEFAELAGPYRRFVAERYGRLGVPAPQGPPPVVEHLADLVHNRQATGLADLTSRTFFSHGTLPDSAPGADRPPKVAAGTNAAGYASQPGVAHLARWQRDRNGDVAWSLDEACYADYATILLPRATLAAWAALEHLFRGQLQIREGNVVVEGTALGRGHLVILAEDAAGIRRILSDRELESAPNTGLLAQLPSAEAGRRMVVMFHGLDAKREPIVLSVEAKLE